MTLRPLYSRTLGTHYLICYLPAPDVCVGQGPTPEAAREDLLAELRLCNWPRWAETLERRGTPLASPSSGGTDALVAADR